MPKVQKIENKDLCTNFQFAKITEMGNITELQMMTNKNNNLQLRKIDRDNYVDLRTGELKEYKHTSNRSELTSSIRKSMKSLRGYINTNVTIPSNCKWVTFTYADNMTDIKQLYTDFKKFWKRFIYQCQKREIEVPEYISVIEPQGRGAWHIHAFFIYSIKCPFIPKNMDVVQHLELTDTFNLADIWGHGFVDIQDVKSVDNVGAYFTAYLTDIPLEELGDTLSSFRFANTEFEVTEKTFENAKGETLTKKFVKGARLLLYPSGTNLFRRSKGIKEPTIYTTTVDKAQKKVAQLSETFSTNFEIVNDDGKIINTISKKYYKRSITQYDKKNNIIKSVKPEVTQ